MAAEEFIYLELSAYENSLVKQFHAMEKLDGICRRERELILKGASDSLMKNTEEKEAALDKLCLLEENSRMLLQKMVLKLKIHTDRTNINDILPHLDEDTSWRISQLIEGINALADSAKSLNMGNQALVITKMDWLKATQSFISSLLSSQESYNMPLNGAPRHDTLVSSMEYRI